VGGGGRWRGGVLFLIQVSFKFEDKGIRVLVLFGGIPTTGGWKKRLRGARNSRA